MPKLNPWWCFSIPTANTTTPSSPPSTATTTTATTVVKLIMCNGQIKTFHRSIPASELMSEFPSHLVCHSDSFLIGQKVPALDANDMLELGHSYFLLPSRFFHSVLSLVSIAASFSPSDRAALLKMVEIQRTPSGKLRIRVSDEFMGKVEEGGRGRVCTTAELEREYKGMVKKRRDGWMPKLETIKEVKGSRSKRIKFKRKDKEKAIDKVRSQDKRDLPHPPPPPPPPPPPKVAKLKKKDKEKKEKVNDKSVLEVKENYHQSRPPPPPPLPKASKIKKKDKDKDNAKDNKETRLQDKSYDHHPSSPPSPPLPKASKIESKEKKRVKDKDDGLQTKKDSRECYPPPPPPPPPPATETKSKEKKRKKEKRENEGKKV